MKPSANYDQEQRLNSPKIHCKILRNERICRFINKPVMVQFVGADASFESSDIFLAIYENSMIVLFYSTLSRIIYAGNFYT